MIFAATYVLTLLLIPSLYGDDDFCQLAFEDEELHDAFNCSMRNNTSSLTNLTKKSDEGELEIIDATESDSQFNVGEEFYLDCCFYSQPYCPKITWYKDGVEIKDDLTIRKINHGRTLKIYGKLNAGGNYTCTATTPYGEAVSHNIENVQVYQVIPERCTGKLTVVTIPVVDVIRVKKGSRQVLVWNFICFGDISFTKVICHNDHNLISGFDSYYSTTHTRSQRVNKVLLQHTITISNFSRSENITCTIDIQGSPSATFVLLEEIQQLLSQSQNDKKSFFKEKGVWLVTGGSLLLCLVVVVLVIWLRRDARGKKLISYPLKETI